jgi:hypothetical protein
MFLRVDDHFDFFRELPKIGGARIGGAVAERTVFAVQNVKSLVERRQTGVRPAPGIRLSGSGRIGGIAIGPDHTGTKEHRDQQSQGNRQAYHSQPKIAVGPKKSKRRQRQFLIFAAPSKTRTRQGIS